MTEDLGFKVLKSPVLNESEYTEFAEWANSNLIKFTGISIGNKHAVNFDMLEDEVELMLFAIFKWNFEVLHCFNPKINEYDFS